MDDKIAYNLEPSPFLRLFGLISALLAVAVGWDLGLMVGLFFAVLSIAFFIPKREFQLDLKNQKYRKGMRVGEKTLPVGKTYQPIEIIFQSCQ